MATSTLPSVGGAQLEAGALARPVPAAHPLLDRLPPAFQSDLARRSAPWLAGAGVLGLAAISWSALSEPEQKTLFQGLAETDKAAVADVLETGGIGWHLDDGTGAITVAADDYYRARMLAASEDVPKAAASGTDLLDTIPMGSSRPVEAERLRQARERELALSVQEIDGIEAARVHLAEAERSLFVREAAPTRASVFVTVPRGRRLGEEQVAAIVNLLAGSVSALTPDNVNVVDQHGRLLSRPTGTDSGLADRIDYQARLEDKLREQLAQLLGPMFGPGNFTVEVQAEVDLTEASSARESYDKDKVLTSERSESSNDAAVGGYGIPGATSNVPPPASQVANGPPASSAAPPSGTTESESADRNYAVGRELSVTKAAPGGLKRLSVAVVLSETAGKKKLGSQDVAQVEQLVRSAIGIDDARGDQVSVVARAFVEATPAEEPPFWRADWFMPLVRQVGAVLVALLVVLFGFRPLMARLRRTTAPAAPPPTSQLLTAPLDTNPRPGTGDLSLDEQLAFARTMAEGSPERVAAALRVMMRAPTPEAAS